MKKSLNENSMKVLTFLKENDGVNMTVADIAAALDMSEKQVGGIVTAGLIGTREPRRNYAERVPAQVEVTDEEGNVKFVDVKFVKATAAGMAYDHDAALAEDAAAAASEADAQ